MLVGGLVQLACGSLLWEGPSKQLPLFLDLGAFPQCCLHCCWTTGQGPGMCLGAGGGCWRASVVPFPGGRDKRAVSPEPAVALSSLCPRFPACLEVLCYIWVNQRMLSDVLATGELLGSAGELLQGQELPRLSLLPSTAMERAPEAAPRRLPSPSWAGRDLPEVLPLPGQHRGGCHVCPFAG